jgi:ABC-2 type transport system permease protein
MNGRVVWALVVKDLTLFFRNRFFAIISMLGLVAYVGIYFAMPRSVDEMLEIGLYAPSVPPLLEQLQGTAGLKMTTLDSEAVLKDAVAGGQFQVGVVLPGEFVESLQAGRPVRVEAYFAADVPQELEGAVTALMREFAYLLSGQRLPIQVSSQVLGRDMAGVQIPPRDRMLPLYAVFIMLTETMGLASLISEEVQGRTIQALMVTPMTVPGLFLAKGITGVSLAFGQVVLFTAATGGLSRQPLLVLVALFLGAILVTGIGFALASLGKDLMSVVAWSIPMIMILNVPTFGVLFPGTVSDWAKVIPSYYLADTFHQAVNYGAGWGDLWQNLVILLGFDALFVGLGVIALRRRLR